MNAFELFPFEVWEKILEKLEDANDKLILIMIDPALERGFQYKRKEWQFPAILPILISNSKFPEENERNVQLDDSDSDSDSDEDDERNLENEEGIDNAEDNWNFEDEEDISSDDEEEEKPDKSLSKAILDSRLVSSLCCKMFEKYVESYWEENYGPPPIFKKWLSKSFFGNYSDTEFLKELKNHPNKERTPILSRSITLYTFRAVGKRVGIIFRLLEKIGVHLKELEIQVFAANSDVSLVIDDVIPRMLALTPKLKTMSIRFDFDDDAADNQSESRVTTAAAVRPPLPYLRKLELFSFNDRGLGGVAAANNVDQPQTQMFYFDIFKFQEYFPQLTQLTMEFSMWKADADGGDKKEFSFPNLERFVVDLKKIKLEVSTKRRILNLLKCIDAPILKEFKLYMRSPSEIMKKICFWNAAHSVRRAGVCLLKKRYPLCKWKAKLYTFDNPWVKDFVLLEIRKVGVKKNKKASSRKSELLKGCTIS